MKKCIIQLLVFFTFLGCATTTDDVAFFYLGKDALQYFFPPREWEGSEETLSLDVDFLYRTYALEGQDIPRTVMNFSLYTEDNLYRKPLVSLALMAGEKRIELSPEGIELIYYDRGKARYTSWLPSSEMLEVMREAVLFGKAHVELRFEDEAILFSSPATFFPHISYFAEVLL